MGERTKRAATVQSPHRNERYTTRNRYVYWWVGDRRSPMVLLGPRAGLLELRTLIAYARRDGDADLGRSFEDPGEVVDVIVRAGPNHSAVARADETRYEGQTALAT